MSSAYQPRPTRRARRIRVDIERITEAIYSTLSAYHPMTDRQVRVRHGWRDGRPGTHLGDARQARIDGRGGGRR